MTAATALAVVAGIQLATPDGSGFLQPLDDATARWVAAHRLFGLVGASRVAALVGGPVGAVVLAFAATVMLARRFRSVAVAAVPVVTLGAVQIVVQATKFTVSRPRPTDFAAILAHGNAFPSGHAATAAALAGCVVLAVRRAAPPGSRHVVLAMLATTGAALIAVSRLLLGVHWLSDVAAGSLLGLAIAFLVVRALVPPAPRSTAQRPPLVGRWLRRTGALVAAVALLVGGISFAQAMTAPGHAAADARTVDWLRNNGLSPAVDRAESWWLWQHAPSPSATLDSLPPTPATVPGGGRAVVALPADAPAILTPTLPGEGRWSPVLLNRDGAVQIAVTSLRADPQHPSVLATLAWMDQATVRFQLIAGTKQPFGSAGTIGAQIPAELQTQVLAAFNSGYKMQDTPGGALIDGRSHGTIQAGVATLAIRRDGSATIGKWGSDLTDTADLVAVRQNLHLIIDNGQAIDGLAHNIGGRWGTVRNALPTWRSGIGIDTAGNLIYASGNHLTLDTLAAALHQAGAMKAMELDIHTHMVTYNFFTHSPGATRPTGHKLSADMTESAARYLRADQRDFVAVYPR